MPASSNRRVTVLSYRGRVWMAHQSPAPVGSNNADFVSADVLINILGMASPYWVPSGLFVLIQRFRGSDDRLARDTDLQTLTTNFLRRKTRTLPADESGEGSIQL